MRELILILKQIFVALANYRLWSREFVLNDVSHIVIVMAKHVL